VIQFSELTLKTPHLVVNLTKTSTTLYRLRVTGQSLFVKVSEEVEDFVVHLFLSFFECPIRYITQEENTRG